MKKIKIKTQKIIIIIKIYEIAKNINLIVTMRIIIFFKFELSKHSFFINLRT